MLPLMCRPAPSIAMLTSLIVAGELGSMPEVDFATASASSLSLTTSDAGVFLFEAENVFSRL